MFALLEDRTAPLYNRVTDTINLTHLDIASVLSILADHAEPSPQRLLFLRNLFEGVPKFYRDCFEQNVLAADRQTLLRRIFFESSSPTSTISSTMSSGFWKRCRDINRGLGSLLAFPPN
jgi:hypothetical protein